MTRPKRGSKLRVHMIEETKNAVTIGAHVPAETADRLKEFASAEKVTFSAYVRRILERHVERRKKPSEKP